MKVFAIIPSFGSNELKMRAFQVENYKNYSYNVAGIDNKALKKSAMEAVKAARTEICQLSPILKKCDEQDDWRDIEFELESNAVNNENMGACFALAYALNKILRYLKEESSQEVVLNHNIGIVGEIGFPEFGKACPINAIGIEDIDLRQAIDQIGEQGRLLIPETEEISVEDITSYSERNGVNFQLISNISDVINIIIQDCSQALYEQVILPLCEAVNENIENYIKTEEENEKFKEYYMKEVVSVYQRYKDLEQRLGYYKRQLKEIEQTQPDNYHRPFCEEINRILLNRDPFEVNVSVEGPFKLSENSFVQLIQEGVPDNITNQLKLIKNKEYTTTTRFVMDLEEKIGIENTEKYKLLILKYALVENKKESPVGKSNNQSIDWQKIENQQPDNFRITENSLEQLKSQELPEAVLNELEKIKNQLFEGKRQFLQILKVIIGEENTKKYDKLILECAAESDIKLTDMVGRFKRVVWFASHPDHGGSVKEFRLAQRAAKNNVDLVLMQALILKYWKSYIDKKQQEENIGADNMMCMDSALTFLREAKSVREEFAKRTKMLTEADLTKEREDWNRSIYHGTDIIQKQNEALIVRCREKEQQIRKAIDKIQDLCREAQAG